MVYINRIYLKKMSNSGGSLTKSFTWTAVDRFSNLFIQFVLGIVIARLVTPAEYGVLGILMVFINISNVFIDSGLSSALIYQNKLCSKNLNTTFAFNLSISMLIYAVIFMASPYVESFYNLPKLSIYLRVSALVLFINSLVAVPTAILKIKLDFKSLAISNMFSTLLSGVAGIYYAYHGFGIWALIIQLLSRNTLLLLLLYVQCRWLPRLAFDIDTFKSLYRYGVNIFSASCITKIADEGVAFVIAKAFTPFSLGIYSRSQQFASLPATSIGGVITTALFPSLSSIKDDDEKLMNIFKKVIEFQAFICIPIFMWFAMTAEPIVRILLTDKWIAVVPILQILCLGGMMAIIAGTTEQVLNAKGRSDYFLRQQVVKIMLKLVMISLSIQFGLYAVAIAEAVYTACTFFITNYFAKSVTTFLSKEQLKLIFPYIITAMVSSISGYWVMSGIENVYAQFCVAMIVAVSIYLLGITYVFQKSMLQELLTRLSFKG